MTVASLTSPRSAGEDLWNTDFGEVAPRGAPAAAQLSRKEPKGGAPNGAGRKRAASSAPAARSRGAATGTAGAEKRARSGGTSVPASAPLTYGKHLEAHCVADSNLKQRLLEVCGTVIYALAFARTNNTRSASQGSGR